MTKDRINTLADMLELAIDHAYKDEPLVDSPSLLVLAIQHRRTALLYKLLDRSPDVDAKDYRLSRMTPFQAACQFPCDPTILQKFLSISKSRSTPSGLGPDLLRSTCRANHVWTHSNSLKLLKSGVEPNLHPSNSLSPSGETALTLAAVKRNTQVFDTLISQNADPHIKDIIGWSVLYYACQSGHLNIFSVLERLGIDWKKEWP